MNWRSEPPRDPQAGFTLLESLLAIALTALILGSVYSATTRALRVQADAVTKHEMKLVARAVMDEYLITYPSAEKVGKLGDSWSWTVSETPTDPENPTPDDKYFDHFNISIVVAAPGKDAAPVTLESIVRRVRRGR